MIMQVNLEFNNGGDGVHALAEALQNNNTLTRLDLTANQASIQRTARENTTIPGIAFHSIKMMDTFVIGFVVSWG